MTGQRKMEWLLAEVKSAENDFQKLPNWKQDVLRSRGEQTRHSVDREVAEGRRILRTARES